MVGDCADQAALLQAQAQFDAPARGISGSGGGRVLYRVGGQLGRDHDGILGQRIQLPLAQRDGGELAGGPGGLGHGGQPDAPPPRASQRRVPGAVAVACGLGGSRLKSLIHG
jgi:hypothetical protein